MQGWPAPMGLDDEKIDDPAYRPLPEPGWVMSAASAASGRDAVAAAPSLPPATPGGAPLAASSLGLAPASVRLRRRLPSGGAGRRHSMRGHCASRLRDLVAAVWSAAAVSRGAPFGDFAGAASMHLGHAVPPAEQVGKRLRAAARTRQIEEFTRACAVSSSHRESNPVGATHGVAGQGPDRQLRRSGP